MLKILLHITLFRELWVIWQWKRRNTFVAQQIKKANRKRYYRKEHQLPS